MGRAKRKTPAEIAEITARINETKIGAVKEVLEAFEILDEELHSCWLRNYIHNSIESFWESNAGVVNVPPRVTEKVAKYHQEQLDRAKAAPTKTVDDQKIFNEAVKLVATAKTDTHVIDLTKRQARRK